MWLWRQRISIRLWWGRDHSGVATQAGRWSLVVTIDPVPIRSYPSSHAVDKNMVPYMETLKDGSQSGSDGGRAGATTLALLYTVGWPWIRWSLVVINLLSPLGPMPLINSHTLIASVGAHPHTPAECPSCCRRLPRATARAHICQLRAPGGCCKQEQQHDHVCHRRMIYGMSISIRCHIWHLAMLGFYVCSWLFR